MPKIASGESDPAKPLIVMQHFGSCEATQAADTFSTGRGIFTNIFPSVPPCRSNHLFGILVVTGLANRAVHHFFGHFFLLAADLVFQLRHHFRIFEEEAF